MPVAERNVSALSSLGSGNCRPGFERETLRAIGASELVIILIVIPSVEVV